MSISYPLSLPSVGFAAVSIIERDVVGVGTSPFTLTAQVQQHAGQCWELDITLPPMTRDDAEEWDAFLSSLKGGYGTFLARDGLRGTPRGTWAGSPVVDGAHAAMANVLNLRGMTAGATIKKGDFFSVGSGASTRLHKPLIDAVADGSGEVAIDIWPSLREALSDGAAVVSTNALGTFRLASNARRSDIGVGGIFSRQFAAVEAL